MSRAPARRRTRATSTAVGLALLAGGLVATPSAPVAAAPTDSDTLVFVAYHCCDTALVRNGTTTAAETIPALDAVVEGDFSAAPGTDLFLYTSTASPDGVLHVAPDGEGATSSFRAESVNGEYRPVAGDFDGNGLDDIFWYGGPDEPDSIWLFQPDGSHQTRWFSVTGSYRPVVLDSDGDGYDDIIWYGVGSAPDSMWMFGPGATPTKRSVRIDGHYDPLVGHFGGVPDGGPQEQVIWYAGFGADSVWTFTETGKTTRPLPNEDGARAVVGDIAGNERDAVYWYRPGSAVDTATAFGEGGGTIQVDVPQVRGTYVPAVGDFDGDADDDIAWTWAGEATIWHSSPTILTYTQTAVSTGYRQTQPAIAHPTAITG